MERGCQCEAMAESEVHLAGEDRMVRFRIHSCQVEGQGRWTEPSMPRTLMHTGTENMSGFVSIKHVKFDCSLRPHIAKAQEVIKDYTAIFSFNDGSFGSGTFVNIGGFAGILTAYHVAEHVSRFADFVLVVANYPHRLEAT